MMMGYKAWLMNLGIGIYFPEYQFSEKIFFTTVFVPKELLFTLPDWDSCTCPDGTLPDPADNHK